LSQVHSDVWRRRHLVEPRELSRSSTTTPICAEAALGAAAIDDPDPGGGAPIDTTPTPASDEVERVDLDP
jgi:hypothetical protein